MMTSLDPRYSLTDDALVLILHAEADILPEAPGGQRLTGLRRGRLGGSLAAEMWLRETAVLRLISTVEAYSDALVQESPNTWKDRKQRYLKKYEIEFASRPGWDQVDAGIHLRNCIAHGLGNLTPKLQENADLGRTMENISVSVSDNRMHLTAETVPILAAGCRSFVCALEEAFNARLQGGDQPQGCHQVSR